MFLAKLQSCIRNIDRKVINILLTPRNGLQDWLGSCGPPPLPSSATISTGVSRSATFVGVSEKQSLFGTGQAIFRQ
jgi:hypothetical protein